MDKSRKCLSITYQVNNDKFYDEYIYQQIGIEVALHTSRYFDDMTPDVNRIDVFEKTITIFTWDYSPPQQFNDFISVIAPDFSIKIIDEAATDFSDDGEWSKDTWAEAWKVL